jgi:hypothetical protein
MRRIRAIDVVFAVTLAAFVVIEVVNPSQSSPAAMPKDTVTHVDVRVGDARVTVTPSNVAAGQVEITVVDERTDKTPPLTVTSAPAPISLAPGTSLWTLRVLRTYALGASAGGTHLASGSLSIVEPTLRAPREPVHQVTLDLRTDGLSTPKREARLEQPMLAYVTPAPQPPDTRAWTTVAPGDTTIVIHNHASRRATCRLDGQPVAIGRPTQVTLTKPEWNFHVLACSTPTTTKYFDLWLPRD